MAFPKFHGITLANNSWVENFYVERLAADPMPISAGRIWYNTAQNTLKYSSFDSGGAVIVGTIGDLSNITTAINAVSDALTIESARAIAAEQAEQAARIAADATLTTNLANEVTRAQTSETNITTGYTTAVAGEAAARTTADAVAASTASDLINTETSARIAGDATQTARSDAIQTELSLVEASTGLHVGGTFIAPINTTYLNAATSVLNTSILLDAALAAEVAFRTTTDAALASGLANEAQARASADTLLTNTLQSYIDSAVTGVANTEAAETIARIAGDNALQTLINNINSGVGLDANGHVLPITGTNYLNAVTTVFGGAFALDTQIKVVADALAAETTNRTNQDNAFQTSLTNEIANRTTAVADVQTQITSIEAGAGLEHDGSFVAPTNSNYLNTAISLKDESFKLDAALFAVSQAVTAIGTGNIPALQAAITAETNRAETAESSEATARATADATGLAATATEATRAQGIEAGIRTDLTTEVTDRTNAIATVTAGITSEATRAESVESGIRADLTTETAARIAGDNAAAANLASEAARAEGIEAGLRTDLTSGLATAAANLASETTRASTEEANLQSQITAVVAAAGAGSNALKAEINSNRFTYQSPSPAMSFVIQHNLNTSFYLLQLMVQGSDGVYRNDIAPVEEIDINSFSVTLTEIHNIRVSVMNVDALA